MTNIELYKKNCYHMFGHVTESSDSVSEAIFNKYDIKVDLQKYNTIAYLYSVVVFDEYKGYGLGKMLVDKFIEESAQEKSEAIVLVADLNITQEDGFSLISFYEKFGFKVIKKTFIPNQKYAVMVKDF